MLTPDELFEFIDELRRNGYNIGADQYIAAQDLLLSLVTYGQLPNHVQWLRTYLAPIFCTSPQEQTAFYERFDQWLAQNPHLVKTTIATEETEEQTQRQPPSSEDDFKMLVQRSRAWPWIVSGLALFLITVTAIIFLTHRPPVSQKLYGTIVAHDSTAVENASVSLLGDSTRTDRHGHFSLSHPVKDSTAHLLIRHVEYPLKKHPVRLNRSDTSRLVIRFEKPDSEKQRIIDFSTIHQETSSASLPRTDNLSKRPQPLSEWALIYRNYFKWIRISITGLPVLIFVCWWSWQIYRRRLLLEKRSTAAIPELQRLVVKGTSDQLFHGPVFRRTAQQLRRHREVGSSELDVSATVGATIQQGGWFKPVYSARQVLPEYLVLIDRVSFHDQQARRVDEIIARLKEDGVFIDRYYFDSDPRFCSSSDPKASHLSLEDLAMRYPDHRLIIFSDGAGLMNPLTGRPQRWLELFSIWHDRALLTPESPNNWGYREIALSGLDFVILPATQAGLNVLIEAIHADAPPPIPPGNGTSPFPPMLLERPQRYLERHEPELEVIDQLCSELLHFLGEKSYYWLSACAIYPVLAWDLTLYLGYRLTDAQGERLLNEDQLLALARLPWLRYGSMPDWLRLRLILSLSREQERAIRQALEDLLKSVLVKPHDGFKLDVARSTGVWKRRDWKRLIRDFLRTAPVNSALRDYVFLTFMSGRKPNKLTVNVPNLLYRIFFRQGQIVFGLQPITAFFLAATFSLCGWKMVPDPTRQKTMITIATEPTGSKVFLNGDSIGTTSINNYRVSAGTISLRIQKQAYFPIDTSVVIKEGDDTTFTFLLRPIQVTARAVNFNTIPIGATVFLNGDSIGMTPIDLYRTNVGIFSIHIQKQDYFPIDTSIVIAEGQSTTIAFQLQPLARIALTVEPVDAEVRLDGRNIEPLRLANLALPVESHRISITRSGYDPKEEQFSLQQGLNPPVKFTLKQKAGTATPVTEAGGIKITSAPTGASVTLNATLVGKTPYENNSIKPGDYLLVVNQDGYEDFSTTINVQAGKTNPVVANLVASMGTLKITSEPAGASLQLEQLR